MEIADAAGGATQGLIDAPKQTEMAPQRGHFFHAGTSAINRLLICSDLGRRCIQRQAAVHMDNDKSDRHQHYRSCDAAQNETDKSQTLTIRHGDAPMSSCLDKTQERAKGSFQAELLCPLRNQGERTLKTPAAATPRDRHRGGVTTWRRRWTPCQPGGDRWRSTAARGQNWWCGRCG